MDGHAVSLVTGNSFIDTLPWETQERFAAQLSVVTFAKGDSIDRRREPIRRVIFPRRCVLSTVTEFADGNSVEVGFAGHEGMSGLPLVYGAKLSPHHTLVQIGGDAYALDADAFVAELRADAVFTARALSYAHYTFIACTQFAACNRLHPVSERYARWLLMAHDRVGRTDFYLTQEYCAQMLGVRRASVTIVAGELSAAGIVEHHRGNIKVIDRNALESAACECYAVVNEELISLMGYGPSQAPAL